MNTLIVCDVFDAYYEGRKAPFPVKAETSGTETRIDRTEVLVERGVPTSKREAKVIPLRR
ncbi:MAG: hypothetical protein INR68_01635 [Methylobacterium mesophilicum]|nr:hypothetical protein [Methylobacterium mesophilicum]